MSLIDTRHTAARAFVRSLNILLKFARLYGFDHARTNAQFETAWSELHGAIAITKDAGLLLGANGPQLLLDGLPVEAAPAERSFAESLSTAGLAGIHFTSHVTKDDLERLIRAFHIQKGKHAALAAQLKASQAGTHGIRIHEARFALGNATASEERQAQEPAKGNRSADVGSKKDRQPEAPKLAPPMVVTEGSRGEPRVPVAGSDKANSSGGAKGAGPLPEAGPAVRPPAVAEEHKAPQLATGKRSADAGSVRDRQPEAPKSLHHTVLTEASRGGGLAVLAAPDNRHTKGGGNGAGSRLEARPAVRRTGVAARPDRGSPSDGGGLAAGLPTTDEEIFGILDLLNPLDHTATDRGGRGQAGPLQDKLASLLQQSREALQEALSGIAEETPAPHPKVHTPLRQTGHFATLQAAEQPRRVEIKANPVGPMNARVLQKVESRPTVPVAHEEKPSPAGSTGGPNTEVVDQQFWAGVPETSKRTVLRSREAWCIPPRNIKLYVEELVLRGDEKGSYEILKNYALGLQMGDREARRRTAIGLGELAGVYASAGEIMLAFALQVAATQLSVEREETAQALITTTFVRLAQEAGKQRMVPVMLQALDFLDSVQHQRTEFAQSTLASMEFEKRVPEMLEEAVRGAHEPDGITPLLQRFPRATAVNIVARFNRAVDRTEWQRLVDLAHAVGNDVASVVRDILRKGSAAEAAETVGLLSRLDSPSIERWLPERLSDWPRSAQDRMVRLLSMAGAPDRGRLLTHLLVQLDPVLLPLAIDEIGFAEDASCAMVLLRMAEGNWPRPTRAFARLKALEALGRLKPQLAVELLRKIAEARQMFQWAYPSEMRLVAAQSLSKMDRLWAREFLPRSGFSAAELTLSTLDSKPDSKWLRRRRYPRVRLVRPMPAMAAVGRYMCRLEIRGLSLSGGVAAAEKQLQPGALASLKIGSGRNPICAYVLMRDARSQGFGFEIADMELEERSRLRQLLLENAYPDAPDRQKVPTSPSV